MKTFSLVVGAVLFILVSCHPPKNHSTTAASDEITHKLYFVRHAETEKNAGTSENEKKFSSHGVAQIEKLQNELVSSYPRFHYLYVSPLWRAKKTIEPYLKSSSHGYGPVDSYVEENIQECCWDSSVDKKDDVVSAAKMILNDLKREEKSVNVLVVGHYHSGKILLDELVSTESSPQNAKILTFDLKVKIPTSFDSKKPSSVDPNPQKAKGLASCTKKTNGNVPSVLEEISGIDASTKVGDVYYAHNDSGGQPRIYKIDGSGRELGTIDVSNAVASDWEDISVGPCGDGQCIFVADIGNNGGDRVDFQLYEISESSSTGVATAKKISFRYSHKGEGYNAEAFSVNPKTGDKYVIRKTKENNNTLYRFPSEAASSVVLEKVCDFVEIGNEEVTASDIHQSGQRMLVRSYQNIYEYSATDSRLDDICSGFSGKVFHAEPQGEAIAYLKDSDSFITASEKKSQPIYKFDCAKRHGDDPDSSTPSPSPTPSHEPLSSDRGEPLSQDGTCVDIPPKGSDYSCEDQLKWGKCNRSWMLSGNYCAKSCGRCGNASPSCVDIPPPGSSYTCAEQVGWDKCTRPWMLEGDYCKKSCGRC